MAQHLSGPADTTWAPGGRCGGPDPELLARAAEVLGVETAGDATSQQPLAALMVTVVGPDRRAVRRVPADVPVGALAGGLGAAVGVKVVSSVSLRDGRVLSPAVTLAEAGVRNASVILVDTPGVSRAAGGDAPKPLGGFPEGGQRGGPTLPATGARPVRGSPARWATLAAATVAVVVISAFVGAAVFGGASASAVTPPGAKRLAARAAGAWMAGATFDGPRLAGVPADLGRTGPGLGGRLEEVGFSSAESITDVLFIASPAEGQAFGLSVVVYAGKIAYPPSVTPLPFATSLRPGRAPLVPEGGRIVAPTAATQAQAQSWAAATFTAAGFSYSLAGKVRVLNQWDPKTGAAMVARVQVPLRGAPAGSPELTRVVIAKAGLTAADDKVTAAGKTLDQSTTKVADDQGALGQANAALASAQAAAAAGKNTPPLAAAVTAAQTTFTNAQHTLAVDQAAQSTAQTALAAAKAAETSDRAGLAGAEAALPRVMSVYDVAYDRAGRPIAWAPADYQIGGTP